MKYIILILLVTATAYAQVPVQDSVGHRYGRTISPTVRSDTLDVVSSGNIYGCSDCTIYLRWKAVAADTLFIEQRVIGHDGLASWQKVPYRNLWTGALDTTGYVIFNKPFLKLKIEDNSSGTMLRLRKSALFAAGVWSTRYSIYQEPKQ